MRLNAFGNVIELIELGDIVIYNLSDGQGGYTQRAAIVVGVYPDAPTTADLRIFPRRQIDTDLTYVGIGPIEDGLISNRYSIKIPKP